MSSSVNNISNGFGAFPPVEIPPPSSSMIDYGNYIAGLITIISLLALFFGAIKYLSAGNDKNNRIKAQKIILYGFIGMLIVGLYYVFTIEVVCCTIF